MTAADTAGSRCVALLGPYMTGKTTLLESILHVTGKTHRKGTVTQGNTVGDASPEARAREMSVELNVATTDFLGSSFTFLDCPGSFEFGQEAMNALVGVDAAVVVCEPEADKLQALQPLLHHLASENIPHLLFVNKIDKAAGSISALFEALKAVSAKPLVLREIPLRKGETITGYVDLAHERAYVYRDNAPSERIDIPTEVSNREAQARYDMLEILADFDEHLMEELLEDTPPPDEEVYEDLAKDLGEGLIVPVFFGAAEHDNGVTRLLKALRHEVPGFAATRERLGLDLVAGDPLAQVLKTYHTDHGGKLSVVRVMRGRIADGTVLNGERISGVSRLMGHTPEKQGAAEAGDVVALGRMDSVQTGDTLRPDKTGGETLPRAPVLTPIFGLAIATVHRSDEVKLPGALHKLIEEDPSLSLEQNSDTHEMVLWGQGEIHLKVAAERLKSKFGLNVTMAPPAVPYKEAIRKSATQRARHKKQSGGHGQFGDVELEIKPLPRGSGFVFDDRITGGVVPKQYIPSVEYGVKDYLQRGPLGFPVVDIAVTLTDGSYHSVDSSDMAFRAAGRAAMAEALPKCNPVLLEPVLAVEIMAPSEYTARLNAMISSRRGQILGFDARPGWPGWDVVQAHIPQSEMHDLIVELRSISHGVGTFTFKFDHLATLTGRLADQVIEAHKS